MSIVARACRLSLIYFSVVEVIIVDRCKSTLAPAWQNWLAYRNRCVWDGYYIICNSLPDILIGVLLNTLYKEHARIYYNTLLM
jgi:hypothetical protein